MALRGAFDATGLSAAQAAGRPAAVRNEIAELGQPMKGKRLKLATASVLVSLLFACSTAPPPPKAADYRLAVPQAEADRAYLGLPQEGSSFRLEDIRCDVLVIDCFDMYCHICQAGAPHVNELYRLAQARGLGNRVKFVGLGAGDTPLEVATYREKFKVPFPVFPDRRVVILKQFGELKLPNLIILRNRAGKLEVINQSPGPILNPAKVLSHIETDLSRLQPHRWDDAVQTTQPTCAPGSRCCRSLGGDCESHSR